MQRLHNFQEMSLSTLTPSKRKPECPIAEPFKKARTLACNYTRVPDDLWVHCILPFVGYPATVFKTACVLYRLDPTNFASVRLCTYRSLTNRQNSEQSEAEMQLLEELITKSGWDRIVKTAALKIFRLNAATLESIPSTRIQLAPMSKHSSAPSMLVYDVCALFAACMQRHGSPDAFQQYSAVISERTLKAQATRSVHREQREQELHDALQAAGVDVTDAMNYRTCREYIKGTRVLGPPLDLFGVVTIAMREYASDQEYNRLNWLRDHYQLHSPHARVPRKLTPVEQLHKDREAILRAVMAANRVPESKHHKLIFSKVCQRFISGTYKDNKRPTAEATVNRAVAMEELKIANKARKRIAHAKPEARDYLCKRCGNTAAYGCVQNMCKRCCVCMQSTLECKRHRV